LTPEDYAASERRETAYVLHRCTQEDRLKRLEAYEVKQNGSLEKLSEQMGVLILRVPHNLETWMESQETRLRSVESQTASRGGAISLAKWVTGGLLGFSGCLFVLRLMWGANDTLGALWNVLFGGGQ